MAVDQIGGTRDFPVEAPDYTPGQRRRVIGAASLGWGMEYFDFMLPSLLAPQIERAFHISTGAFSIAIVVQLVGLRSGGCFLGGLATCSSEPTSKDLQPRPFGDRCKQPCPIYRPVHLDVRLSGIPGTSPHEGV